jgi:hypothetical protein
MWREFEKHLKEKINHTKDWNEKTHLKYAFEEIHSWNKRDNFPKLSKFTLNELEIYLKDNPLWLKMLRKVN